MNSIENNKAKALQHLYELHKECLSCAFGKTEANHKVFGEGNPDAKLMIIGEAPGADEDRLKRPFVGRSGKLLDKLFAQAGFSRQEIYITNIVKCRPPNNRTPLPDEISPEIKQLLKEEISIIRPRIICTVGAVATQLFFKIPIKISQVRGKMVPFESSQLILFPTFHPAYALRDKNAENILAEDIFQAFKLSQKSQFENKI